MYSALLRNVFLPAVLRRDDRQSAIKHWRFFQKSQFWSRQRLLDYQFEQMKIMLAHAYHTTKYYRNVFDERGLTPESFKSLDDLALLPIMTRDLQFRHLSDMISSQYAPETLMRFETGGTTGQRATLYRNFESNNIKIGGAWRFESWMGRLPCDKMGLVWPASMDFLEQLDWKQRIKQRYFLRQVMLFAGTHRESDLDICYREMRRFNPRFLKVFPTALFSLAEYIESTHLPSFHLDGILSTGEPLYGYQRKRFSELFGCDIIDMYGSRETGNTAGECPAHEGLHISMETVLLEFVENGRPVPTGQRGRILITDLTNFGVPVIRYQIDDYGKLLQSSCSCGRGLTLMSAAVGRVSDDIIAPDGQRVTGNVIGNHLTSAGPEVGQLQVVQKSPSEFVVRVTNRPPVTQEHFDYITGVMTRIISKDINIKFEVVERIEPEKSGKVRFVVSHLAPMREESDADEDGDQ
ncbi:MAG: hypothetical protein KKA42_17025 [candidate division Zixibacteria bacterium]|nr:hypothetical protein [candidate division Zixibacteria bacterium]